MFELNKLQNGKFFAGSYKGFESTKGWFVGKFLEDGNPCQTDKIEILYKEYKTGDIQKKHYHREKVELLLFLRGKAKYQVNDTEVILKAGDFLFVDVNNCISGEFLEDSTIFALHSPSIPTDKVDA